MHPSFVEAAGASVLLTRHRAVVSKSIADVAERLMDEFGGRLGLSVVSAVVLSCRDDLVKRSTGGPPDVVERLARQQLLGLGPDQKGR